MLKKLGSQTDYRDKTNRNPASGRPEETGAACPGRPAPCASSRLGLRFSAAVRALLHPDRIWTPLAPPPPL